MAPSTALLVLATLLALCAGAFAQAGTYTLKRYYDSSDEDRKTIAGDSITVHLTTGSTTYPNPSTSIPLSPATFDAGSGIVLTRIDVPVTGEPPTGTNYECYGPGCEGAPVPPPGTTTAAQEKTGGPSDSNPPYYCNWCRCYNNVIEHAMTAGGKPEGEGWEATGCPVGMAQSYFSGFHGSVLLEDDPFGLLSTHGPPVGVIFSYNSHDATIPRAQTFTHMGPGWRINWVQYLDIDTTGDSVFFASGRATTTKLVAGGNGWKKRPNATHDTFAQTGSNHYTRTLPSGAVEIYSHLAAGTTWRGGTRLMLTEVRDSRGQSVTLSWENIAAGARLKWVTDASGRRRTKFFYEDPNHPLRVSKITSPVLVGENEEEDSSKARTVSMDYNTNVSAPHAQGTLFRLTDPAGITSEFHYQLDRPSFVERLQTPYGDTQFSTGIVQDENNTTVGHYVTATDPAGKTSRIERRSAIPVVSPTAGNFNGYHHLASNESLPEGYSLGTSQPHETLLWTPKALDLGMTTANARIMRWAENADGDPMPILASEKAPLTNRVWYAYTGASAFGKMGTSIAVGTVTQKQPDTTEHVVNYEVNASGLATSIVDTHFSGSGGGRTEFGRREMTFEYHSGGRDLWKVRHLSTNAQSQATNVLMATLATYEQRDPREFTAADGTTSAVTYNSRGQPTLITNALGEKVLIAYDDNLASISFGKRTSITEAYQSASPALARITSFGYDTYGRLSTITDPEGRVTTLHYDAAGGAPLASLNRVIKVTYPDGKFERVEFDPLHPLHVEKYFDIEEKVTTYERDGNGDVLSMTTPDGKTVSYERGNCCGSVDTLVDAKGQKTHWEHDVLGRVKEKWLAWETGQAVKVADYTFDTVGRPVTKTDARGNVRTIGYDSEGRMNAITYTLAQGTTKATANVAVTYEPQFGRVASVTDGTGTHTYSYVQFAIDGTYGDGALASVTTTGATGFASSSHSYVYDKLGRTEFASIDGKEHRWNYDALGRLKAYHNPLDPYDPEDTEQRIAYAGTTDRVEWTKIGALKTAYAYTNDANKRLTGITHTWNNGAISSHSYGYDAVGRLTLWTKTASAVTKTWAMAYDASEQLETVGEYTGAALTDVHHYTYDDAGNRTSEQRGGGVRSWEANAFNQLTTQNVGGEMELRGTVTPRSTVKINNQPAQMFDGGVPAAAGTEWRKKENAAQGVNEFALKATEAAPPGFVPQVMDKTITVNIQPQAQIAYQYDADGNMLTDGITSYEWDAENRLVAATSSPVGHVEFVYDAFNRRVRIIEKAPSTSAVEADKQLVWEGLSIVRSLNVTTNDLRHYYPNGETREEVGANPPVVMAYIYTRDHLGSIREMLNADDGSVAARYDYSPYGIRTKLTGSLDSDFGFTGHYTNDKSGLVLVPYRAYSPLLGRWISRDPIEEDGGLNLYGYVGGSPEMAVDPLGLRVNWDSVFTKTKEMIAKMRKIDKVFDAQVTQLEKSDKVWRFYSNGSTLADYVCKPDTHKQGERTGGKIGLMGPGLKVNLNGEWSTSEEVTAHEIAHAVEYDSGTFVCVTEQAGGRWVYWIEEAHAVRSQNRWSRVFWNSLGKQGPPKIRTQYNGRPVENP